MEPDATDVDQNNGKDITDIGPLRKEVCGVEEVTDAVGSCMDVESSDHDSASTTKRIIGNPTTAKKEEGKECSNREGFNKRGLPSATEAEERDDDTDLSNSIASANPEEDTKINLTSALDEDESKSVSVGGTEQPERKGNIALETEFKVATRSGIETSVSVTDLASVEAPTDSTIDASRISSPVSTDGNKGTNIPTHEKAEGSHSSPHRKGLRFRSTNSNKSSRSTSSDQQCSSSLIISSLSIDSLHSIASFLIPTEWENFGQCNKATNKICREVFRRIRMHGFRCATEVVTAWVSYYFVAL